MPGADPGFFLGGGAPLRNDVTDGEVKKFQNLIRIYEEESFVSGGDAHPLHPPPRSAPVSDPSPFDCLPSSWMLLIHEQK